MYYESGEASDLLLDNNLVLEFRRKGDHDALTADTRVAFSILKYGEGVVEAHNLSFLGNSGSDFVRKSAVRELELMLPHIPGLIELHKQR